MPLTDFVRYLNAQLPPPASVRRSPARFFSDAGHVHVDYADLRLGSEFSTIVATRGGEVRGHAARLRVLRQTDGALLDARALFALPGDDQEIVYVDRLVRTLHTLNYLTYGERRLQSNLLLKVHPRHVASVSGDHGLAFEEILRACRFLPQHVTLELEIPPSGNDTGGSADDVAHWSRAMDSYQARGYGVALKHFGGRDAEFALVERIGPSFVRLDRALAGEPAAARAAIGRLRALSIPVLGQGAANESVRAAAWHDGVDFLQYEHPRSLLRHASPSPQNATAGAPWSVAA